VVFARTLSNRTRHRGGFDLFLRDGMDTAKISWAGRSQAVRLPKQYRLKGKEVRIRRHGSAVILEPLADEWAWLDAIAGSLDEDFVAAVGAQPQPQERAAMRARVRSPGRGLGNLTG
jgi:antitoxin VapB